MRKLRVQGILVSSVAQRHMAEKTDGRSISGILTSHGEQSVQFLIYEGFQKDTVKLLLSGLPVKIAFLSTPASHISPFEKGIVRREGHESRPRVLPPSERALSAGKNAGAVKPTNLSLCVSTAQNLRNTMLSEKAGLGGCKYSLTHS